MDMKTAYHIVDGPKQMYAADAAFAVRQHPGEWSYEPWSVEDTNNFRRADYERKAAEARRNGLPEPEPPADLELTPEQQTEIDEDGAARAEAAEIVRKDDEMRAEQAAYDRKLADARALLASAPTQPTPIAPAAPRPRAEIPIEDGWKDWSGPKKRSLAMRLGAANTVTVQEAEQRIEEETKRRKEQGPTQGASAQNPQDRGNPSGSAPTSPLNQPAPNAPAPIADPYAHQPNARPEPDPQPQSQPQSPPAPQTPPPYKPPAPSATFENSTPKPTDPAPKAK